MRTVKQRQDALNKKINKVTKTQTRQVKQGECPECYHLLKETPGKGCANPGAHYGKINKVKTTQTRQIADAITVLTEFCNDVETVTTDHVQEDWPDLLITYHKAKQLLWDAKPERQHAVRVQRASTLADDIAKILGVDPPEGRHEEVVDAILAEFNDPA